MKNYSLIAHDGSTELVYNDNNHVTGVCYLPLDLGESIMKAHLSHHFVIFVLKGKVEITEHTSEPLMNFSTTLST